MKSYFSLFRNYANFSGFMKRGAYWTAMIIHWLILLIPLLAATFYFLNRNIDQPVGALVRGSDKIREGEYGYRIEPFRTVPTSLRNYFLFFCRKSGILIPPVVLSEFDGFWYVGAAYA